MTRAYQTRIGLQRLGIEHAAQLSWKSLGKEGNKVRNLKIVQRVIFEGDTIRSVADDVGLSHDRVRQISLCVPKRHLGYMVA